MHTISKNYNTLEKKLRKKYYQKVIIWKVSIQRNFNYIVSNCTGIIETITIRLQFCNETIIS